MMLLRVRCVDMFDHVAGSHRSSIWHLRHQKHHTLQLFSNFMILDSRFCDSCDNVWPKKHVRTLVRARTCFCMYCIVKSVAASKLGKRTQKNLTSWDHGFHLRFLSCCRSISFVRTNKLYGSSSAIKRVWVLLSVSFQNTQSLRLSTTCMFFNFFGRFSLQYWYCSGKL